MDFVYRLPTSAHMTQNYVILVSKLQSDCHDLQFFYINYNLILFDWYILIIFLFFFLS